MSDVLSMAITATLVLYAVAMGIAMARLFRGPSAQDRVLAMDFIYVVGMLVMLVLAIRYDSEMYFEGALLMVLFGFVGIGGDGQVPAARRGDLSMPSVLPPLSRDRGGAAAAGQRGVVLVAALGLWRLPDFFLRMHAPALASTLAAWIVTLASIVHFSARGAAWRCTCG
jgi:multicomponent K+:H+ antiporter subunit F